MIVGIDLGTTNSLIAYWEAGKPVLLKNPMESSLTPSVVSIDHDASILIGKAASERLFTHPHSTAAHFKRYMGSNREILLGNQMFHPEQLSALILKSLKADADNHFGTPITEAVISVPAYFNDKQRKATKIAGELIGLKVDRLINEPTAAGLAYGLHELEKDTCFLVFDLGGGTFDVSIIEIFDGVMEIKASTGDNYLGGEDFTKVIINEFIAASGIKVVPEKKGHAQLISFIRAQAERAKISLTQKKHVLMSVHWKGKTYQHEFTQTTFKKLCADLLQRLRQPIERALRDCQLQYDEIDNVILVGGATRMPIIKQLVATLFGKLPLCHINPDEVVAIGAAIQAGLKRRDKALEDIVVTDVCPYTLGIDAVEHVPNLNQDVLIYQPIIERNTVIPVSQSKTFVTGRDGQTAIRFHVYQGESPYVEDNILLQEMMLPIPENKAGKEAIDVRFTYDINGLLEVEVTTLSTQEKHRVVIENNPGLLTQEEIDQRFQALSALKIHPREKIKNRQLLAQLERLHEELIGDHRALIANLLHQFSLIVGTQNNDLIDKAYYQIKQKLDMIERELGIL